MADSSAPNNTRAAGGSAPSSTKLPPGAPARIGRFEVRSLLGEGAFGRVYRGYDGDLRRDVAIKVPHAAGLNDEFRERFLREARAIAAIHHPNVCPVFEVGTEGELPYIVMKFVAGTTLASVIDGLKTPMPIKNAVMILRKLALGMAAAHANGVTHRDLKPANVLYDTANREVLITDFGLARVGGEANLTAKDSFLGTPAYTSPEQANRKADQVGPLSDVYSLGVILYEMLTGDVPFNGSVMEVAIAHCLTKPDPPSTKRAEIDARLDAVVLKAMEKKPADRFKTAREFADVLTDYLRPSDSAAGSGSVPKPGSVPELPGGLAAPGGREPEPAAETVAEKRAGRRTTPAFEVSPPPPPPPAVVVELDDEDEAPRPSPKSSARKSGSKSARLSGAKPPKSTRKKRREEKSGLGALLQNKAVLGGGALGLVVLVAALALALSNRPKADPTPKVTPEPSAQQQQPVTPPVPPVVPPVEPPPVEPPPGPKTGTAEAQLRLKLIDRWKFNSAPGLTALIKKANGTRYAFLCLEFKTDGTARLGPDALDLDTKIELEKNAAWKTWELKYRVVSGTEVEFFDLPADLPPGVFNNAERVGVRFDVDALSLTDSLGQRRLIRVNPTP